MSIQLYKSAVIVALDGPAGSGKTSTAKAVASALNFAYLDTGAMYRAVTLAAIEAGIDLSSEQRIKEIMDVVDVDIRYFDNAMHVFLNGKDVSHQIRSDEVNNSVSLVSSYRDVRNKMVALQRGIGNRIVAEGGGVVIDGRDIGTVVFPKAEVKVFMRATAEVRARRRVEELKAKGVPAVFEEILENIQFRDKFDSSRAIAPLKMADDACELDTSVLSFDQQVSRVVNIVKERQVRSDV